MTNLDKFQSELGISEEKLTALYNHPDFNGLLTSLEESNPRFKDLPGDMKKLAMAMFLQGDTDKISGLWKFFFKRPIPTIEEFLTPEYIGSDASFYKPWSPWYKDLTTVFAPESMIYEWCLTGCIGCLSSDTEFLTEFGWKPISEYKESDKVGVYHPNSNTVLLESPSEYIKLPCEELTLVQNKGLDMCLSDEHRVVYWNKSSNIPKVIEFKDLKDKHNKSSKGWTGKIKTTFKIGKEGLDISEGELRLQVAVLADGHFSPEGKDNYCAMRFSKTRKYERLLELCKKFNLQYKDFGAKYCERYSNKTEYKVIVWPKFKDKTYNEKYWSCSQEQLEIIADEVGHWDGSFYEKQKGTSIHFFSVNKGDADFIQYAFASSGYATSCSLDDREGKECYIARACYMQNGLRSIESKDRKLEFKPYKTSDGKKYCFEVSTGMFVARRNGKIFITGNSAKSSVSRIAQFYNLYRITSLRYPQLALGTGETKPMCLIFLTVNKLKASESMVSIKTLLKQCKYFIKVQNEKEFAPYLDNEFCQYVPYYEHKVEDFERVTFPNNVYVSLGTQLNHTIGSDLFGAVLDEAEFKKGPNASKEAYDFYTELLSRVTTRFIDTKYKLVTLVSSVKHDTGVISKHIEDLKYKKGYAYLSSYPIWEVKEQYRGSFEKYGHFYALRGTMSHPSKVLDEIEYEQMENGEYICPDNCKVIKVPKHPMLVSPFLANPDRALKEQAGEATSGGERPFDNLSSLEDLNLAGEITLSASLTEKKSLFDQLPELLWQKTPAGLKLKRFPNAPRYLHLDLADSGEAGISMCHKEVSSLGQIIYVFDFVAKVVSPTRISQTMIEEFIVDLKEVGSIMIELLSADQYQSTYLRERLENQHKVAKYVKRVPIGGRTNIEPVLTTAVLISEGAVKVGPCIELKQQLRGVFIYKDLLEYETERKDMVDTFVGTLYGALNSSTDIPTNIYESYERITKTLDLSMLDGLQEL